MARPRGPDAEKYWKTLSALWGRRSSSFGEIVQTTKLSRGTVNKILRDVLVRGLVTVNYRNQNAYYSLTDFGYDLAEPLVLYEVESGETTVSRKPGWPFFEWWTRGRPPADEVSAYSGDHIELASAISCLKAFLFLVKKFPGSVISDDSFYPEGYFYPEGCLWRPNVKELFQEFEESWKRLERRLVRARATNVKQLIKWRRIIEEPIPEEQIIATVGEALLMKKLCPTCFGRRKLYMLEAVRGGYSCKKCGSKFTRPWDDSKACRKLYRELMEWMHAQMRVRIGRTIYEFY